MRPFIASLTIALVLITAHTASAALGVPFGGTILFVFPFPSYVLDCDTPPGLFVIVMNIGKPPGPLPLVVLPPPLTQIYKYGALVPKNFTLGSYNPVPTLCIFGFPPAATFVPAFQATQIGTGRILGQ